ncbi:MAG: RnfABCDGE type electron transport complex subunit D [Clostridia bacterium]|nr:RnfABCDGE type electron transport complex subunit D [Clostridia bacterium]
MSEASQIKKDTFYKDMLPALILPLIMAIHFYGKRAALVCLVSVSAAVICEIIGSKIINQKLRLYDFGSVYIGVLLALMMPASVRLWVPALGSAFAVMLVKIPFGGIDTSPFSCTAAAISFLCICKSNELFAYPVLKIDSSVDAFGSDGFVAGTSVAQSLLQNKTHGVTAVELINSFIGAVPGPMGMTSAVVLLGILLYILIRRPKTFVNAISFIATCFVGCVITVAIDFGNIFELQALRMICVRLFSGFALCIGVFLITEEPQSPDKIIHRIIYGCSAAVGYIILRYISVFEDAGTFAVLAVNAFFPLAEKYIFSPRKKESEENDENEEKADSEVMPLE